MRVVEDQRYISRICFMLKGFDEKSFNRLLLIWFIFVFFLITLQEKDIVAETYLEPFQTYMMNLFCENSYFSKKSSIIDNWHGYKYASRRWYLILQ